MTNENKSIALLIIEDDQGMVELLQYIASNSGVSFDIYTANFIEEVHEDFLSGKKSGVIVLDLMLNGRPDGSHLGLMLKKKAPENVIIVVTGYINLLFTDTSVSIGFDDFLVKPFSTEDFEKSLIMAAATYRRRSTLYRCFSSTLQTLNAYIEKMKQLERQLLSDSEQEDDRGT